MIFIIIKKKKNDYKFVALCVKTINSPMGSYY